MQSVYEKNRAEDRKKLYMKCSEINIRDPFVLYENGKYYMYGTRAADFGKHTGGFCVYPSNDLKRWGGPAERFDSVIYGFKQEVKWGPVAHK